MSFTVKEIAVSLTIVSVLTVVMLARDTVSAVAEGAAVESAIAAIRSWRGGDGRSLPALLELGDLGDGLRRRWAVLSPTAGDDGELVALSQRWTSEGRDAVLDRLEDLSGRLDRVADALRDGWAGAKAPAMAEGGATRVRWQTLVARLRLFHWKAAAAAARGREDEALAVFDLTLPVVAHLRTSDDPHVAQVALAPAMRDLAEVLRAVVAMASLAPERCEALARKLLPLGEDLDRRRLAAGEKRGLNLWRRCLQDRWPRGFGRLDRDGMSAGPWMATRERRIVEAARGADGRAPTSAALAAPEEERSILSPIALDWPTFEGEWRAALFALRASLVSLALRGRHGTGPWPTALDGLPAEFRLAGPDGQPMLIESRGAGFTLRSRVDGRERAWVTEAHVPADRRSDVPVPADVAMPGRYVPSVSVDGNEEETPAPPPMRITAIVGRPPRCMAILVYGDREYVIQQGWRSPDGRLSVVEMDAITATLKDEKTGVVSRLFAP